MTRKERGNKAKYDRRRNKTKYDRRRNNYKVTTFPVENS